MPESLHPYRVRLGRGRHVHAAGHIAGFTELITACGAVTHPDDEHLDDDTPVTCPKCLRAGA